LYISVLIAGSTGATGSAGSTGSTAFIHTFDAQSGPQDPEALYRDRENLASAKKATDIWAKQLEANPRDFNAAARLAQARYWLGTNGLPEAERKGALEGGIAAGRTAIALDAKKPEGYFWLAANMGALAESYGLRQGIKYRGQIRDALEMVLKIDPAFQDGSADRAIGRWYFKVPGLFGGSNKESEKHLRKSLAYNQQSIISHLFLAETLLDMGRKDDAKKELQAAIDAPLDPYWGPEDKKFKERARALLTSTR
jgi:tetratricopeptide (TPR) repeat protein